MAEPQAPHSESPLPVQDLTGTTVGRFAIRARLGAGGMGEVYRAEDTKLKRPVALKRMAPRLQADERYRRRFLKEAERASALSDQHIAGLYDVLEERGEIFLVMEYVEGVTLRQRLAEPISLKEFLSLAVQCATALVTAHGKGILHRDLKPENIMLTPAGQVKVLDFGVAKRLPRADDGVTTETLDPTTGGLSGTPAYMAPEVLLEQEPDGRADIFSLGVVFYEALTGRHPFRAGSFLATTDRILHAAPAPLREANPRVPAELERIVAKMLAKEPTERYATAADLLVDLRALEHAGGDARLLVGPGARRLTRRERWGLLVALAGALALVVGFVPAVRQPLLDWLGLSPIPEQKNLVVLPFQAIGGGPENQVYCDGLTDTVTAKLTQLTRSPNLQVAPASEVRARKVTSAEQARTELGANLVVEASWQRSGENVRINLVLVDARRGRQLRADTVTAPADDLFALQDQVVESAVRMLEVEVPPGEAGELVAHGTAVPTAYDFYIQGRGYLQNYDKPENIEKAISAFQRALELDPRYALAFAGLGDARWKKYEASKETRWVEGAREACERALALEAKLAAAHVCLGTVYNGTGEYEKAVTEFERAAGSEPTNDDAYRGLGRAYERLGQWEKAEQTYRKAIELRPHYWAGYSWLGAFYFHQGRYASAAQMFEQVVALAPDNARGYSNLGAIYVQQGRYPEAITVLERSLSLRAEYRAASNLGSAYFRLRRFADAARAYEQAARLNERDHVVWGNLGSAYYWAPGERGKAQAAFERGVALAKEQLQTNPRDAAALLGLAEYSAMLGRKRPALDYLQRALRLQSDDPEFLFTAAVIHNQLGDRAAALAWLEKAVGRGYSTAELRNRVELDNLREDPKFQALIRPT